MSTQDVKIHVAKNMDDKEWMSNVLIKILSRFLCNVVMPTQDVKIPVAKHMDNKEWMSNTLNKIFMMQDDKIPVVYSVTYG